MLVRRCYVLAQFGHNGMDQDTFNYWVQDPYTFKDLRAAESHKHSLQQHHDPNAGHDTSPRWLDYSWDQHTPSLPEQSHQYNYTSSTIQGSAAIPGNDSEDAILEIPHGGAWVSHPSVDQSLQPFLPTLSDSFRLQNAGTVIGYTSEFDRPQTFTNYLPQASHSYPDYSEDTITFSSSVGSPDNAYNTRIAYGQQGRIVQQYTTFPEGVDYFTNFNSSSLSLPISSPHAGLPPKPPWWRCNLHRRPNAARIPSRTKAVPSHMRDETICGEPMWSVQEFVEHLKLTHKITGNHAREGRCWCAWPGVTPGS
ncbi:unnamed protein product [Cyclocybe aegerita]|uniref:Uncharacterized protein n=1 Tax=Cyclocybe aegerita TaxID=1973307 RepID=A0A8S0VVQ0_CYCAE|nr:unnamed protein product [Cyclocybe aegerita]